MQLSNVPPQRIPLRIAARRTFTLGVDLRLADGTIADLTDHLFIFYLRKPRHLGGGAVLSQPMDSVSVEGRAQLLLTGLQLDLPEAEYDWAISMQTEHDYNALIAVGSALVEDNPTVVPAEDYDGLGTEFTLTMAMDQQNRLTVTLNHLLPPSIEIAPIEQLQYWETPRATFEGAYPKQILHLALPGPGNGEGLGAPSLDNIPPGSVIAVLWDGTDWKIGSTVVTTRPTARTDITIHLIDPIGSAFMPGWVISNDIFDQVV